MIGRLLCRIGLHRWTPPRADGYARSVCRRCGRPFYRQPPPPDPAGPREWGVLEP